MKQLTSKSLSLAALGISLALTSGCRTSYSHGNAITLDQTINRQLPVNLGSGAGSNTECINTAMYPKKVFKVLINGTPAPSFLFAGPNYAEGSPNVIPNPNKLPRLVLSSAFTNIGTGFLVYPNSGINPTPLGCGSSSNPWSMTLTLPTGRTDANGTARCVVYYNDSAAPFPTTGNLVVGSQYTD